jgi:glycosyltransferase involved in cell wall biosynthesis
MPLRIHHYITRLILGGAQENTLLTCEGLHARGHDVTLVTGPPLGTEGELLSRARRGGYRVIELDSLCREISPWNDGKAYRALRKIIRTEKPDIVHTHSSKAGILGRRAARKEKVSTIVHTIHGLPFHEYQNRLLFHFYRSCERRAAFWCDHLICVGEVMREKAIAAGVGIPEQYSVVRSGMEMDTFLHPHDQGKARDRWSLPRERKVIGVLSRLAPLKGHMDLIQVAENVHLFFVGDGELRSELEQEARKRNLPLTITGMIDPGEIPEALAAMDILVHPSYREGLPRAVVQGLLSGTPVVAFDCDGAKEVIVNGKTGFLVPPGNPKSFSESIQAAFDSGDKVTNEGRNRCLNMFSAEKMVLDIEKIYENLRLKK